MTPHGNGIGKHLCVKNSILVEQFPHGSYQNSVWRFLDCDSLCAVEFFSKHSTGDMATYSFGTLHLSQSSVYVCVFAFEEL